MKYSKRATGTLAEGSEKMISRRGVDLMEAPKVRINPYCMKTFFTVFILLVTLGLSAQSYNNEWIDFSKTYYKFKVATNGLYRIPRSVLAGAGLQSVPAEQFQLFRNGQEVPIYTSVASGVLGTNDYIEFWGKMNDGAPDQPLYRSPTYQHTQKWSLETDTAVYFLTVKTSGTPFHFINTTNDTTGTILTAEPFFYHKAGGYFKQGINPGFAQIVQEYIYSSSYDMGEFWSTGFIYPGTPFTDGQSNLYAYAAGPGATLSFGLTGCADNTRNVKVTLNGTTLIDTSMDSFYDLLSTKSVSMSQLSTNAISVQYINNSTVTTDRMVASFYELNYPRQFNFGGQPNFFFELAAKSAGYFLKITNLAMSGGNTPVLYDLSEGRRYTAIVGPGNTLSFLLGGSSFTRRLVLVNEDPATVNTVSSLTPRNFNNYASTGNQGNYIIISSPSLYTGSNGNNPVVDYRNYRSSPAGGSFNARVYDIDELVDQFGFGIKKHPVSVQNFLRYARAIFSGKPEFVLLMGHGMNYVDYNKYSETLHDPLADKLNIIPTWGYPASDNKLSAGNALDAVPITPIGRLSVVNGKEIEIYLTKIRTYEQTQATAPNTIDGRLWMKNVLHLTGVSEPFLGTILCNYMNVYKSLISDTAYGANVYTLCDGNASQNSQVPLNMISNLFTTGMSVLTYFGHSSNTALGYNLDDPKGYNNQGKYPVFFINGCDAGDFFIYSAQRLVSSTTLSEQYVLTPDHGAIAFVASTHFGIVNYLNILLYGLYNLIDHADYGKPLGIIQKDALQQLVSTSPADYFALLHAEEMTTHGDPYLRLNQGALPDYAIEAPQVMINPTFVSVSDNSFTIKARFYNLGRSVSDSIVVQVKHQFPDGSSAIILNKKIAGIQYSDSIQLVVPLVPTRDKGQNQITVTINATNSVAETTTANNSVTTPVFVYQDGANPIFPYTYSIINNNHQKLYGSTANALSPTTQYFMEIDTTTAFNSSTKVTKTLTSAGGVLEFDPGITYQDSIVYYWRISVAPTGNNPKIWNNSSFVYIDSTRSGPGSNQSQFFQHTQSTPSNIILDSVPRQWRFDSLSNDFFVKAGTWSTSSTQEQQVSITVNDGAYYMHNACSFSSLIFTVFDPVTFKPWRNITTAGAGLYGSLPNTCSSGREYGFEYRYTDTASRRSIMNFMDMIPPGSVVIVRSFLLDPTAFPGFPQAYAADWHLDSTYWGAGTSIYNRLLSQGFDGIDSFSRPRNFVFVYKKNGRDKFTPEWVFTNGTGDNVSLNGIVKSPYTTGVVTSPIFGPSRKWNDLHWRGSSQESLSHDTAYVQVIGIDTTGALIPLMTSGMGNQDLDISSIVAEKYPYIQLQMSTTDTVTGTPYQLRYWRLNYLPPPEGTVAPNIYYTGKDTLQIGDVFNVGVAFKNVSPYPFTDSVRWKLNIIDKNNVTHSMVLPRKKPLISGDTLTVSYQLDTKGYAGSNMAYLEVNPDNAQPEQYHFNNFMYKNFYVVSESRNPVLDVTFDNIHILNDDIVSSKPHIQVKLQGQSKYALLTDTSLITVQLRYPDGTLRQYYFNNDTLRFTPANSGNDNVATVDFNPAFLTQYKESGDDYELIVSGKDQFGNTAGSQPYRVSFKIITKPMISNLLNYPNPFTTSTAFVFTITGSEVPQNMKIQILTITGKIVREITKDELGPLHVGRNITEFKWNATDMYGQRLANGVYLYHVVTNLNGKSLDKYKASGDNTDKYFNNGYGKMYLMR
jgi:hypothetical protein